MGHRSLHWLRKLDTHSKIISMELATVEARGQRSEVRGHNEAGIDKENTEVLPPLLETLRKALLYLKVLVVLVLFLIILDLLQNIDVSETGDTIWKNVPWALQLLILLVPS